MKKYLLLLLFLNIGSLYPQLPTHITTQISNLVKSNPGQLSFKEYSHIAETIQDKSPCNILVFGVGKDSFLWNNLNKHGLTLFIEDNAQWLKLVKKELPFIKAHFFTYKTVLKDWQMLLNNGNYESTLLMDLPSEITYKKWDIIFVDAPGGYSPKTPGRMQSIYTASVLAKKNNNSHVFVHDCNRPAEKAYCDKFLQQYTFITEIDKLRHYYNK